jgi:hypothetical protein
MNHGKICECSQCQPIKEPKIQRVIWFDDGDIVKVEAERVYYLNHQWFITAKQTHRSGAVSGTIYHLATWRKMEGGTR